MVSVARRARAFVVAIILLILLVLIAAPALYALLAWDCLMRVKGSRHRARVAAWQRYSGLAVLKFVCLCMGIDIRFDLPDGVRPEGPFLVISNHLGGFDGFLVIHVLRKLGRSADLRAIGKRQAGSWPVLGRAWRELDWGFVRRTRDKHDYDAVLACGRTGVVDGADVLIFPEGTSFDPAKRKPGLTHVLPPKSGGFRVLHGLMPERPVLDLTLCWDPASPRARVGLLEGSIPYGRELTVRVRFLEVGPNVEPWLLEEWQKKDAWLSEKRRYKSETA